jgi:hypothetical protein
MRRVENPNAVVPNTQAGDILDVVESAQNLPEFLSIPYLGGRIR